MDGVTILNTYQEYSFGGAVLLSVGIAVAAMFAAAALASFEENVYISGFFAGLVIVLAIGCFRIRKTKTCYEVILSNDVKFTEFTQHYEVQKVRGQILTVTEVKND